MSVLTQKDLYSYKKSAIMNPNPLRCDKSFTITYIKALKRSTIMKSIKKSHHY